MALSTLCISYINKITQHVIFCVWLLSHSILFLKFIHVVAHVSTSFLHNIPLHVYISIWFSVAGPLGGFCFLAVMQSASLNMCVYLLFQVFTRAQLLSCVWLFATPWTVAHRLFCPGNFPGKNTAVGCLHTAWRKILLQRIFPTQGSNTRLLHCRQIFYHWATRDEYFLDSNRISGSGSNYILSFWRSHCFPEAQSFYIPGSNVWRVWSLHILTNKYSFWVVAGILGSLGL